MYILTPVNFFLHHHKISTQTCTVQTMNTSFADRGGNSLREPGLTLRHDSSLACKSEPCIWAHKQKWKVCFWYGGEICFSQCNKHREFIGGQEIVFFRKNTSRWCYTRDRAPAEATCLVKDSLSFWCGFTRIFSLFKRFMSVLKRTARALNVFSLFGQHTS